MSKVGNTYKGCPRSIHSGRGINRVLAITLGLSTVLGAVVGFGGAAFSTGLIQSTYHGDGIGKAILKGLLAGLTVGIPFPGAGTAMGGVLALSGLDRLWSRSDREKMAPPSSLSDDDS